MKQLLLQSVLMTSAMGVAVVASAAGNFTWQSSGAGGYSGSIADSAHWGLASGYPGSGYPDTGRSNETMVFPGGVGDYTVTFPSGTVTNLAGFTLGIATGETITFDVSQTTWQLPDLSGLSLTYPVRELLADGGRSFVRVQTDGQQDASPIPLTLDRTVVRYSSETAAGSGTVLSFDGGAVTMGNTSPYNLLLFGGRAGYTTGDAHGSETIRFVDSDFTCNGLSFGFSNPTNVLAFSGGTFTATSALQFVPYHAPVMGNDVPGLWAMSLSDGCVATMGGFELGYNQGSYQSAAKAFSLSVTGGSHLTADALSCNRPGSYGLLFSGNDTTVTLKGRLNGAAGSDAPTVRAEVSDGAYLTVVNTVTLGSAADSWAELVVSNATLESRNSVQVTNGRLALVDGAFGYFNYDNMTWFEGKGASSAFHADGGRIEVNYYNPQSKGVVFGFGTATLGAKGLTVDSASNAGVVYVPQNFTDAPGAEGRLILRRAAGSRCDHILLGGTDSRETYLDITQGKVIFEAGANHRSHVTVTNNATLSLVGTATGTSVRSLTLGNAVSTGALALDPGDVIELAGPLALARAQISFSSDLGLGTNVVFSSTVAPTDATVAAWEVFARSAVTSGLPSDKYCAFQVVEKNSAWLFQIVVSTSRPALTGETGWQGTGTAAWTNPANWSPSVPTATDRAVIAGNESATVTVAGTVDAAAIRLATADHTVSGGTIRLSDNADAALEVQSGQQEIASSLRLGTTTAVSVSDGASLTLSGTIMGGGLAKSGDGVLNLTMSPNILPEGFSLAGGTLHVAAPDTLGSIADNVVSTLSGGTLDFAAGGVLNAKTQVTGPVVYKTEGDVEMPFPTSTGGAVIKRGAGRLTMTLASDTTSSMTASAGFNGYTTSDVVSFPATGAAPAKYAPLTVCSGEYVLKGTSTAVPYARFANQILALAPPPAEGKPVPAPGIVIDHAKLGSFRLFVADGVTDPEAFDGLPQVIVRNSGILVNDEMRLCQSGTVPVKVSADNGTVSAFMEFNNSGSAAVTNLLSFVNDSRLLYGSHRLYGSAIAVFTNSAFANTCGRLSDRSTWTACSIDVSLNASTAASFTFSQGSVFACKKLSNVNPVPYVQDNFELVFDGSEWYPGSGDFCLVPSNLNTRVVVTGGGLRLHPNAGETWTLLAPVTGSGGLVKEGEGTLRVTRRIKNKVETADPVTLACSGVNDVRAGTLAIESGAASTRLVFRVAGTLDACDGALEQATLLSAGGTLRHVALDGPVVGYDTRAGASAVLFDGANGCSVTGHVTVDFGRAPDDPLDLNAAYTVARWSGASAPNLRRWRATGLGDDRACAFSLDGDGNVVATVGHPKGLVLIVR